jgi:hypothetical protein
MFSMAKVCVMIQCIELYRFTAFVNEVAAALQGIKFNPHRNPQWLLQKSVLFHEALVPLCLRTSFTVGLPCPSRSFFLVRADDRKRFVSDINTSSGPEQLVLGCRTQPCRTMVRRSPILWTQLLESDDVQRLDNKVGKG